MYVPIQDHSTKILTTTQKYEDEMKTMEEKQQTGTKLIYNAQRNNGVDKLPKTARDLWNQS